ncbi:DUF393 domain-containing protein (plasmid) [Rhodobacteraceae bacterium M382]|nr:DUF393 domain-containing protein [Rhodobacteraceae bacterium M382]
MAIKQKDPQNITVFYDGSCPLCASEICYYKRADTDHVLNLVDVSSKRFSGDDSVTRSDAMARFHVRLADGRQMSGARAFVELWRAIPGWRWLARLASLPGVVPLLEGLYRLFLRMRPLIVRGFGKYQRFFGTSLPR